MTDGIVWPTAPPTAPPTEAPPSQSDAPLRPIASPWSRAGELLLEPVLMVCTLGFGWVGWWIITWADGQSPAKAVLHLHVVDEHGRVPGFGRMAVREALGKAVAGVAAVAGLYFGLLWPVALAAGYLATNVVYGLGDPRRRTLWDRLANTVVLEGDPPTLTRPAEAGTALP